MKVGTCDLAALGARMKAARAALGLSQKDFHNKYVGMTLTSFQRAEAGSNEAGWCLIESFVRAGINANWLLTGEGPMRLDDLAPKPIPINTDALAAIIEGLAKAGCPPAKLGQMGVRYYQDAIAQGLITPTGVGNGSGKNAA